MSITNKHLQHLRSRLCEYKQIRKEEIPTGSTVVLMDSIPTSAELKDSFDNNIQPAEYIQVTTNNWYYQLDGKAPSTDILLYGELAVSYQKGYEKVFFKNSENELVSLQPITNTDSTVIGESNNVDVEVKQENGKITNVVVTDRTDEAIENAIQQLDSTVTGESDNVNIKIYQTDGLISNIVVTDTISDTINNILDSLDSDITSTNGTNVNVQVVQENGKITKVNVTDNGLTKKLVINNNELTVNENNECKWSIPYTQLQEVGIDPDTACVFVREIQTGIQLTPDIQFNNTDNNLIIKFSCENNISANTYKTIILS